MLEKNWNSGILNYVLNRILRDLWPAVGSIRIDDDDGDYYIKLTVNNNSEILKEECKKDKNSEIDDNTYRYASGLSHIRRSVIGRHNSEPNITEVLSIDDSSFCDFYYSTQRVDGE